MRHRLPARAGSPAIRRLTWTGSEFGVVWNTAQDGVAHVFFTRLTVTGERLGVDILVSDEDAVATSPSLVWTGTEYGVGWWDYRHGDREIYFVRLSEAGAKNCTDVRLTEVEETSGFAEQQIGIVWTGSEFGMSWIDSRSISNEVYFTRLSDTGIEIGNEVLVSGGLSYARGQSLAWTGSQFALSWADDLHDEGLSFALVSSDGLVQEPALRFPSFNVWPTSLVWTGTAFGVAWGHGFVRFTSIGLCK